MLANFLKELKIYRLNEKTTTREKKLIEKIIL